MPKVSIPFSRPSLTAFQLLERLHLLPIGKMQRDDPSISLCNITSTAKKAGQPFFALALANQNLISFIIGFSNDFTPFRLFSKFPLLRKKFYGYRRLFSSSIPPLPRSVSQSELVSNLIYKELISKHAPLHPYSERSIILVIGDRVTGTSNTVHLIANHISPANLFILNEVEQFRDLFFLPYHDIKNDSYLSPPRMGKDKKYHLLQKYKMLLEREYDKLKPELIGKILKTGHSLIASLNDMCATSNLHALLLLAQSQHYKIHIVHHRLTATQLEFQSNLFRNVSGLQLDVNYIITIQNKTTTLIDNLATVCESLNIVSRAVGTNSSKKYDIEKLEVPTIQSSSSIETDSSTTFDKKHPRKPVLKYEIYSLLKHQHPTKGTQNIFFPPPTSKETIIDPSYQLMDHTIPLLDPRYVYNSLEDVRKVASATTLKFREFVSLKPWRFFQHLLVCGLYQQIIVPVASFSAVLQQIYDAHGMDIEKIITKVSAERSKAVETTEMFLATGTINADISENDRLTVKKIVDDKELASSNKVDILRLVLTNLIYNTSVPILIQQEMRLLIEKIIKDLKLTPIIKELVAKSSVHFLIGGSGAGKTSFARKSGHVVFPKNAIYFDIDDLFNILYGKDPYVASIIFSEFSFEEVLLLQNRIIRSLCILGGMNEVPNLVFHGLYLPHDLLTAYNRSKIQIKYIFSTIPTALARVLAREGASGINPLGSHFIIHSHIKSARTIQEAMYIENEAIRYVLDCANYNTENEHYRAIFQVDSENKTIRIYDMGYFINFLTSSCLNSFALSLNDILNEKPIIETAIQVASSLRKFFDLVLYEPGCSTPYARLAREQRLEIVDGFVYRNNIDPWLALFLQGLQSSNMQNFEAQDATDIPEKSYSKRSNFVWIIKRFTNILHQSTLKGDSRIIMSLIHSFQSYFEGHINFTSSIRDQILQEINSIEQEEIKKGMRIYFELFIQSYANAKSTFTYEPTAVRFFESRLAERLLDVPPNKMMREIEKVSEGIIFLINQNIKKIDDHIFIEFLERLKTPHFTMGRYPKTATLADVINVLKRNRSADIINIMLTHFIFMEVCFRKLAVYSPLPLHGPLNAMWNKKNTSFTTQGEIVDFIDHYLYQSNLFKDRGRDKILSQRPVADFSILHENNGYSPYMGIMNHYCLPGFRRFEFPWRQDRFYTKPDMKSNYVKDTYSKEIPYIGGPSGMTTLLISAALLVGKLHTQEEFLYYFLACTAYLVGAGVHNFHEVIIVAHDKTRLIHRPVLSEHALANPPNVGFQDFISFFSNDSEVSNVRATVWNDLLLFCGTNPVTQYQLKTERLLTFTLDKDFFLENVQSNLRDQYRLHNFEKQLNNIYAQTNQNLFFNVEASHAKSTFLRISIQMLVRLESTEGICKFVTIIRKTLPEAGMQDKEIADLLSKAKKKIDDISEKEYSPLLKIKKQSWPVSSPLLMFSIVGLGAAIIAGAVAFCCNNKSSTPSTINK